MSTLHLKLGTRKSLLAWSQSRWVADQIEKLHPQVKVEMVGIETQGDKILDKPLSQIEGKEFFTAELDRALLKGEVDLSVHSLKDLSLDRPPQLELVAIPKRELPHDVVIFHESVIQRLSAGKSIRVGTSSPRRLTLVPKFLTEALPRLRSGTPPQVEFKEIRGNVNTRLSRIHEPETSERKLDAVVLAFAGLERLSLNPEAHQELNRLLEHTRLMVVPVHSFPSAPAQGALAIECRTADAKVKSLLRPLHDSLTELAIRSERQILGEWGGGCHQKLGATAITQHGKLKLHIAGIKPDGTSVEEKREFKSDPTPETTSLKAPTEYAPTKIDAADVFDFESLARPEQALPSPLFIAHIRAFEHLAPKQQKTLQAQESAHRIWVSGWPSWKKLAEHGVWVEGCLEGQGFSQFAALREKKLLRLPHTEVGFLSHDQSGETPGAELLATYTHRFREIPQKIWNSQALYWGSGLSFEQVWSTLSHAPYTDADRARFKQIRHHCGPGKTADKLRSLGFQPEVES